jgi:hypothetical protein
MPRTLFFAFAISFVAGAASCEPPQRPEWMSESAVKQLRALGVDPDRDLAVRGNYHWRWVSRRPLVVGRYRCPIGSFVDASRTITVVGAPESTACRDGRGAEASFLKLHDDGSAEPL